MVRGGFVVSSDFFAFPVLRKIRLSLPKPILFFRIVEYYTISPLNCFHGTLAHVRLSKA